MRLLRSAPRLLAARRLYPSGRRLGSPRPSKQPVLPEPILIRSNGSVERLIVPGQEKFDDFLRTHGATGLRATDGSGLFLTLHHIDRTKEYELSRLPSARANGHHPKTITIVDLDWDAKEIDRLEVKVLDDLDFKELRQFRGMGGLVPYQTDPPPDKKTVITTFDELDDGEHAVYVPDTTPIGHSVKHLTGRMNNVSVALTEECARALQKDLQRSGQPWTILDLDKVLGPKTARVTDVDAILVCESAERPGVAMLQMKETIGPAGSGTPENGKAKNGKTRRDRDELQEAQEQHVRAAEHLRLRVHREFLPDVVRGVATDDYIRAIGARRIDDDRAAEARSQGYWVVRPSGQAHEVLRAL